MSFKELFTGGGGLLLVVMTLVQIAPVKLNPWTGVKKFLGKIVGWIGKSLNAEVSKELADIKEKLENHIKIDDERAADEHRAKILRFNNEMLRDIGHTKEEFIEVLAEIDAYEAYCKDHEDYKNNRAVLAIENIRDVYKERLKKHDFLPDSCVAKSNG